MKKQKSFFEKNGGTYTQNGDVLLPDLSIGESEQRPVGKYGRMRNLKEHHPVLYSNMLLSGKLFCHLAEIDQACEERLELLIRQIADRESVNEEIKAADQMAWVARMNSIRSRAEEIVLHELVYTEEGKYADT